MMENLQYPQQPNNISYPGMFNKFGLNIDGIRYLLKIAKTEKEELCLHSEKLGTAMCQMMDVPCSDIRLVHYGSNTALLSKDWHTNQDAQFFPLASYYEELLDIEDHYVDFTYLHFKNIVSSKCSDSYDRTLDIFWRVYIIDYLLCNARSAGNLGFIDCGTITISPIYDNSTWLDGIDDNKYLDLKFPTLLMSFDVTNNSAYTVLTTLDDPYKENALFFANSHLNLDKLSNLVMDSKDEFLFNVITHRYNKLFLR